MMISFFVAGVPVPKGSAKAFVRKRMKHPVVIQDNAERQRPWASSIGYAAQQEVSEVILGPVGIGVSFTMPRLASHFGTGKNAGTMKATAPMYHTSKPDLDKLLRCVKDALTGVVWKDDAQVAVVFRLEKKYGAQPGVRIEITRL